MLEKKSKSRYLNFYRYVTVTCQKLPSHCIQHETSGTTILPSIEPELHSYMGGICKNLECYPVIVGGYIDHIHILCMLSKKIPLIKLLAELKAHSSKWVKTKGQKFSNFYWQDGYGAFSVNPYDIDIVKAYIERQHEHHQRKTFQDEFRGFLKKYEVEYDERYVWD